MERPESVLRQIYRHRETMVVADGSIDDTVERLEPYRSFIRYVRQENAGQGAARRTGIRHACSDYIALLDTDDLWLPEKPELQVAVAQRQP